MCSQLAPSHACSEALNEERTKRQELQEAMQQVCICQFTSCASCCCRCNLLLGMGSLVPACPRIVLAALLSALVFLPTPTCRWC